MQLLNSVRRVEAEVERAEPKVSDVFAKMKLELLNSVGKLGVKS